MLNFKNKTMKKLLLLTKTLLAAALLCVGQNAWGGTSDVFSQASWSHTHSGETGDRSSSLSFTGTSSIDDNWTASFDVTTTSTNSRTNGARNFQVALLSASAASFPSNALATTNVLFGANFVTTTNTDYSSFPCTITVNDVAEVTPVTLNHGTKYTFTVSVNKTSMTVSINNGETSVFSKKVTLGSFVKPKGIYDLLPRPYNKTWGVYTNTYSDILVTKEVTAEEVTNPSISVAYASANRTVTITPGVSSESNEVTTYYTLNGDDPTSSDNVYSAPFDVDEACTVKAISISSTSVASGIASQAVTVGKLKLVAPTFTKTGYAAGKYTVSMASNQSSLAYPPASYTNYYSIDGGDAVAYSAPFELSEGSTVTGYVVATNYTNSDEATLTSAVRPTLVEVWSIDFAGQATEDKGGVTVGAEAFTANGVSFGNITSAGLTSNDNFGVKTGTSWLLRNSSRGLYSSNGSGTPVGVQGLKTGQYIKMVVAGMTSFTVSDAASLVDGMSTETEKYIVVNSDGNANINFNRYGYIKSISVCNVAVPVTVSAAGYATFSSTYDLDFSDVEGLTAYIATSGDATTVTIEPVEDAAAGTGLVLKGDAGTYNIPVIASGTDHSATNKLFAITADGNVTKAADANYTNYVLALQGGSVVFAPVTGENYAPVKAGQAALCLQTGGLARALSISFGDITAVENVEAAPAEAKAKEGKFIENGKLVIVKNGVKYNAAGAQVK